MSDETPTTAVPNDRLVGETAPSSPGPDLEVQESQTWQPAATSANKDHPQRLPDSVSTSTTDVGMQQEEDGAMKSGEERTEEPKVIQFDNARVGDCASAENNAISVGRVVATAQKLPSRVLTPSRDQEDALATVRPGTVPAALTSQDRAVGLETAPSQPTSSQRKGTWLKAKEARYQSEHPASTGRVQALAAHDSRAPRATILAPSPRPGIPSHIEFGPSASTQAVPPVDVSSTVNRPRRVPLLIFGQSTVPKTGIAAATREHCVSPPRITFSKGLCAVCNKTHEIPGEFRGNEHFDLDRFPCTIPSTIPPSSHETTTKSRGVIQTTPYPPCFYGRVEAGECVDVDPPPGLACQGRGRGRRGAECCGEKSADGYGSREARRDQDDEDEDEDDEDGGSSVVPSSYPEESQKPPQVSAETHPPLSPSASAMPPARSFFEEHSPPLTPDLSNLVTSVRFIGIRGPEDAVTVLTQLKPGRSELEAATLLRESLAEADIDATVDDHGPSSSAAVAVVEDDHHASKPGAPTDPNLHGRDLIASARRRRFQWDEVESDTASPARVDENAKGEAEDVERCNKAFGKPGGDGEVTYPDLTPLIDSHPLDQAYQRIEIESWEDSNPSKVSYSMETTATYPSTGSRPSSVTGCSALNPNRPSVNNITPLQPWNSLPIPHNTIRSVSPARPGVASKHTSNEQRCGPCIQAGVKDGGCIGIPPCGRCEARGNTAAECRGLGCSESGSGGGSLGEMMAGNTMDGSQRGGEKMAGIGDN